MALVIPAVNFTDWEIMTEIKTPGQTPGQDFYDTFIFEWPKYPAWYQLDAATREEFEQQDKMYRDHYETPLLERIAVLTEERDHLRRLRDDPSYAGTVGAMRVADKLYPAPESVLAALRIASEAFGHPETDIAERK